MPSEYRFSSRPNHPFAALLLILLMLLSSASATITQWSGPSGITSNGAVVVTNGFIVPGNATVLDGWVNIGVDGMVDADYGKQWDSDGTDFYNGTLDSVTTDHYGDILTLTPDPFVNQKTDFERGLYYAFPNTLDQYGTHEELWAVSDLVLANMSATGGSYSMVYGDVPATVPQGGYVLGTAGMDAVGGDIFQTLEIPPIVSPNPMNDFKLSFTHWYHLNTSADVTGDGDGVWMEYRVNNGDWRYIAPDEGYTNTLNNELSFLEFTLDGDYDGENSTLNVNEQIPSNVPWSGTILAADGSMANYTGKVAKRFSLIDQGNETAFNSSALNQTTVRVAISPSNAPTGGIHGFPVWAGVNASGWVTSNFNLSNNSDIVNSNSVQFRFNIRTASNATQRPGWFIDDIQITNPGVHNYAAWLFGCSPDDGCTTANGHYSSNGGGALVFPIDLSSATTDPTIELDASWALEGGSSYGDHFFIEVSTDNVTWQDVIAAGGSPSNPIPGGSATGDTNGYEHIMYTYPAGFVGDATTWIRVRVETDSNLNCALPHYSVHCGVFIDDLTIYDSATSNVFFSDDFTDGSAGWHEAAPHGGFNPNFNPGSDQWMHITNHQGSYQFNEGFENPIAIGAIGFTPLNLYAASTWVFGEIPTPWPNVGPTSFPSGTHGFGVELEGPYQWSSPFLHTRLTTPVYTLLDNATSYISFNSWICGEPDYDGGVMHISVNGSDFTHFHPYVPGGFNDSWYDNELNVGLQGTALNPLHGQDAWTGDGYGQPTNGGSCLSMANSPHPGWEKMRGSLENYSGSDVQFRLEFASDRYWDYDGWYIDDFGIEVNYFEMDGRWISELMATDDLGTGFVDAVMEIPNGTWITGSVLNAGGQMIPGFENLTIPFSLAGLDLDSYPNIKLQLNFGTGDPHFSPKLYQLFFGGVRVFESTMGEYNGWDVPTSGLDITNDGNMTVSDGQPKTFTSEFLYSSRPMRTFELIADAAGITAYFTDIEGSVLGNITTGQQLVLDTPQPGFAVEVVLGPTGYVNWFAPGGYFVDPAFNPQIDLLRDGVVDWYFPADPYYGHFGWQNRYYGVTEDGSFTAALDSDRGLSLSFDAGETITLHTLVPQNSTVEVATLPMVISDTASGVVNLTTTMLSQSTMHNGLLDGQNVVPLPLSGALNSSSTVVDVNHGRTFWDLQIALTSDNAATIDIGPMALGYDLIENISYLEPLFEPYHQASNDNGTANNVRYNLSFLADRGGVSLDGGIRHELLITNEPFTPPETFYPDGTVQTVRTTHYHLDDNNLIEKVRLRGIAASGAFIEVIVDDLSSGGTFSQVLGPQYMSLVPGASSAQIIGSRWVVDWAFMVNWDWDDEGSIVWSSLAMDAEGYGISPYTAYSGGTGANAVENDLVIIDFEVFDQFGRPVVQDSWVADDTILTVFGNVSFQDATDRSPQSDAFSIVTNLSGAIVNITVGENGSFSGQTTTPVRSSEEDAGLLIRYPISAHINRVGPGDGAVGGTDESRPTPTIEFRIDDDSPHAKRLQIYTSGQYISADGYTWNPANDLPLLLTISDNQSMGSEVTMHYWIQDLHDLFDAELGAKNGVPDANEYGTLTMSLFNAAIAGEETVNFLPLNVEDNEENHRVSIFFTGLDFAGNEYSDGGGPGFDDDFATIYTAINEPTVILPGGIYLDRADEHLMAGQNHTLSILVDEPNGIGTIESIRVHLVGETENTIGVMTYYPVSGDFSTPEGSYVTINGVDVIDMGNSEYTVDVRFNLAWDFPLEYAEQWSSPALIVRDTDPITNPNLDDLVLTNLGEIRWVLDNELEVEIVSMSDITPPMTEPSTNRLYVAEGDEVLIVGKVNYANSGVSIKTIPDEMLVHLALYYGTELVEGDAEIIEEDGGFELTVMLPSRALTETNIPLLFSITGIPDIGVDVTNIDAMIIVDSSAPVIQFATGTFHDLSSDDLGNVLVTVILDDANGGMPTGPLELHWAFTEGFGGPEIIGSRDSRDLPLKQQLSDTWTYQEILDMTPKLGIRLDIGDGLVVWVVGEDLAGNAVSGSGSESQPRYVEIDVKTFKLQISEISVNPSTPFVGEEIKITYLAKNVGNKDGVGNVSLQIKNDFGNWTTITSTMVELAAQQSFEPVAFRYEVGSVGLLEMRIIVDGFEAEPFPITGSNGLPIEVASGDRDDGGVPGFVWLIIGVIGVLAVLGAIAFVILRGGDGDDYIDEASEVYEKSAPDVPTSHGRDPEGDGGPAVEEPAHPDLPAAMEAFPTWGEDVLLQYLTSGWSIEQMKDEFYE